ncbi:cmgc cdk cdk7 protein kinase [Pelomyxa schiedti]|nr:cmgc cdk cdk7 protein kinase [Pelomyxa schiedti]
MERYTIGPKIGHGTFGTVWKAWRATPSSPTSPPSSPPSGLADAVQHDDGNAVAIKSINPNSSTHDGITFTALREIKILMEVRHPNITPLLDVFVKGGTVHLVFQFMMTDLEHIIKDKEIALSVADIKSYMLMLMNGVSYCHSQWVLHRDLKPSNLLIAPDGVLKLSDFGMARTYGSPGRKYTSQVVTRWYRPLELLWGAVQYTGAVDVWSCGCIFAELLTRLPLFPGESDIDQVERITGLLGAPTEKSWPGFTQLPDFFSPTTPIQPVQTLEQAINAPPEAIDLLKRMLVCDPNMRWSARKILAESPYFKTTPLPTPPNQLQKPTSALGSSERLRNITAKSTSTKTGRIGTSLLSQFDNAE